MKKIFAVIALSVCMLSFTAWSQTLAGTQDYEALVFQTASATATDSSIQFYAPFNMYVQGVHSFATDADTGSASPAATVTLYKITAGIASAAQVTYTITAANALSYGVPATTAAQKLVKGGTYKIKYTLSTGDTLAKVNTILWYLR